MAAGMSAAGSRRFCERPRSSGPAILLAEGLFLPDELSRPVALAGGRGLHALQPAEHRQIRCGLVGIPTVDIRHRRGSIALGTLCLAPHVRLPESPFRLVASCVYFGCTAGLLFGIAAGFGLGFAPGLRFCLSLDLSLSLGFGFGFAARPLFGFVSGLLFGFAPGLGLGVAVRLLFGLSSGFGFAALLLFCFAALLLFCFAARLLFCFATRLLFCFATRLLFCFATRLLFCFATRALFCYATRPLFRFASGLGFGLFGFAPSSLLGFTVRRVRGLSPCLCLGFATGLLLGEPCPRLRLFGVDCVALCQRLPFRREAHLPFLGLPPSE